MSGNSRSNPFDTRHVVGAAGDCRCMQGGGAACPPQEKVVLHGVDVTGSNFLSRPAVLEAAAFAEAAHQGQMRRTGDPYIMHCVETACIVEGLLALSEVTEDDARWLPALAVVAHVEPCMRRLSRLSLKLTV